MTEDVQAICDLIATWMSASREGDIATITDLMTEDVVFLQSGQPPMRGREAFVSTFKAGQDHIHIDARSDIQEIQVESSIAYCWNQLSVTITPLNGDSPAHRAGNVLTVLRKESDGRWRICRDANLLS